MSGSPRKPRKPGKATSKKPPTGQAPSIPKYLLVLAGFDKKGSTVHAIEAAKRPPRKGKLQPVRLTNDGFQDYPIGTRELVVTFHGRDGRLLASWGQSARAKTFVDVCDTGHRGVVYGGLITPRKDVRLFHLPIPKGAAYLGFFRAVVKPSGPVRRGNLLLHGPLGGHVPSVGSELILEMLGLYDMNPIGPPRPPEGDLEFPWEDICPEDIKALIYMLESLPKIGWKPVQISPPNGEITGYDLIHGNGVLGTNFNVVLLGDGFAEGDDQELFRERCELVKDALRNTAPFSDYFEKTNIFVVETESHGSGITSCSAGMESVPTYYSVTGAYGESQYQGYLGSNNVQRIYEAATHWGSLEQMDVLLMVGNCKIYGGSAFVHQKVVFATLCTHDSVGTQYPAGPGRRKFQNVCLHEIAHEVGRLGEEYIPYTSVPFDPLDSFKNIVRREEMSDPWWKELAEPDELNAEGEFVAIQDCTEERCCHCHNCASPGEPYSETKLGLFWGAQYADYNLDMEDFDQSPCPYFSSPASKDFFRSMASCKMKHVDWNFCRVCQHLLSKEIIMDIEN